MGERFALDPADRSKRPSASDYLVRAATCYVKAARGGEPLRVCKALYGNDQVTPILLGKAASSPARADNAAWAGALAAQTVSSLLQSIVSLSAAADLLSRAMRINFDGYAEVKIPGRTIAAGGAAWIGEGSPIPVRKFSMNSVSLKPHKLAIITSYTNELAASSNIEAVVRSMLAENSAIELDRALFSTAAADATVPGGILAGVAPLAAATGGDALANMTEDIRNLVAALGAAYGGLDPTFVASPGQAAALKFWAGEQFDYAILPSAALAAGTIIAVEGASIAASIADAVPEFSVSEGALLHYEDTTPQDITGGSPSPAVPVKSLFQTDAVSLKMILQNVSWAMRAPHIAWCQNVNW
jgi:HK97 family phage major capsid protein